MFDSVGWRRSMSSAATQDDYAKLAAKRPSTKEEFRALVEAENSAWEAIIQSAAMADRVERRSNRLWQRCPWIAASVALCFVLVWVVAFSCRQCWAPTKHYGRKAWTPWPPPPPPPIELKPDSMLLSSSPSSPSPPHHSRRHSPSRGTARGLSAAEEERIPASKVMKPKRVTASSLLPPPSSLSVEDECEGWRNGTRGTWSDPHERRFHDSAPGGFTSQARQDKLLWDNLFSKLNRTGRYIDCAANHHKVRQPVSILRPRGRPIHAAHLACSPRGCRVVIVLCTAHLEHVLLRPVRRVERLVRRAQSHLPRRPARAPHVPPRTDLHVG